MFNEDCPFCGIARRMSYERMEADGIMRIKPLNPVVVGHMLFVPRQHFEHDDVGAGEWVGRAFEAAHTYAGTVPEYSAFNLITSYGAASTQTVPHLHIHFVPRAVGDGLQLPWGLPHGSELDKVRADLAMAKSLYESYDGDVTLGHLTEGLEVTIAESE